MESDDPDLVWVMSDGMTGFTDGGCGKMLAVAGADRSRCRAVRWR